MKKMKWFKVQLMSALALIAASCSSSEEPIPAGDSQEANLVQVSIGFKGEITSITESPLSRATEAKDWYAFQVYEADEKGTYQGYAYGFFDNKSDMVINLKEGHKYRFYVNMVVDGSEKVSQFYLGNAGWTNISNSFFISSEDHVGHIHDGYLLLKSPHATFNRPNVDRFYGSIDGYIATEGSSISINMKRVSFGAKFVAKGFTEGTLEISVEGAPTIYLDASEGSEVEDIISFNRLGDAYTATGEYSESIPVNIVWAKPDGKRIPIASESVAFKRNKLTTIEFEVKENTTSNSFNLTSDEIMETGETIEIGGDDTPTIVDPQQ